MPEERWIIQRRQGSYPTIAGVVGMLWIRWSTCSGFSGRHAPDYAARSTTRSVSERAMPSLLALPFVQLDCMARHLAEGAFWILKRQQPYRPPANRQASPKQVRGRA